MVADAKKNMRMRGVWRGHGDVGFEAFLVHHAVSHTLLVYSKDGVLLNSIQDVMGWWTEYSKNILNPTSTPSNLEAEYGDLGFGSPMSCAEVTKVFKKLFGVRNQRVYESRPEFLKLDVLTFFKRRNTEWVPTIGGSHFWSSLVIYSGALERIVK